MVGGWGGGPFSVTSTRRSIVHFHKKDDQQMHRENTLKKRQRLKEREAKQQLVKASLLECRVWINYRSQDRTQLKPATAPAFDCRILTAPRRNKLRGIHAHIYLSELSRAGLSASAPLWFAQEDLTGFQEINIYKRGEKRIKVWYDFAFVI